MLGPLRLSKDRPWRPKAAPGVQNPRSPEMDSGTSYVQRLAQSLARARVISYDSSTTKTWKRDLFGPSACCGSYGPPKICEGAVFPGKSFVEDSILFIGGVIVQIQAERGEGSVGVEPLFGVE